MAVPPTEPISHMVRVRVDKALTVNVGRSMAVLDDDDDVDLDDTDASRSSSSSART